MEQHELKAFTTEHFKGATPFQDQYSSRAWTGSCKNAIGPILIHMPSIDPSKTPPLPSPPPLFSLLLDPPKQEETCYDVESQLNIQLLAGMNPQINCEDFIRSSRVREYYQRAAALLPDRVEVLEAPLNDVLPNRVHVVVNTWD